MTETLKSCVVSPYTKCNPATLSSENATEDATNAATINLLALSAQVLRRNQKCGSKESCAVALPKERNYATEQLRALIKEVSVSYGGDDEIFLEVYIDDVIREWSHDLDKAITCFRSLII